MSVKSFPLLKGLVIPVSLHYGSIGNREMCAYFISLLFICSSELAAQVFLLQVIFSIQIQSSLKGFSDLRLRSSQTARVNPSLLVTIASEQHDLELSRTEDVPPKADMQAVAPEQVFGQRVAALREGKIPVCAGGEDRYSLYSWG